MSKSRNKRIVALGGDGLVDRLRALSRYEHDDASIGDEAADEIEKLTAERDHNLNEWGKERYALMAERDELRKRIENAPVIVYGKDCDCPCASGYMDETVIGKRVALVKVE
jgi:hypothetical protein